MTKLFLKFALTLAVFLGVVSVSSEAAETNKELRVGIQKCGTLMLVKARGTLEKRSAPLGVSVKWQEFAAGPQLLEALNVGSIDFGSVGETPPIFAQAAVDTLRPASTPWNLRLVSEIEPSAIRHRNTFFVAYYDENEFLIGCDKMVCGDLIVSHSYEYYDSGALKSATLCWDDDERRTVFFDEEGRPSDRDMLQTRKIADRHARRAK
jgi:hypothetical protein